MSIVLKIAKVASLNMDTKPILSPANSTPLPWRRVLIVLLFTFGHFASGEPSLTDPILFPGSEWVTATPSSVGLNATKLKAARDYALAGDGSGIIVRNGKVAMRWGNQAQKYDLKSSSKSIGITALGLALADGTVNLADRAAMHQPDFGIPPEANGETGWLEGITVEQLARQTAGFAKRGGYEPLLFAPATEWHYSDGGPNWLAECVTLAMQQNVESLLFERVFKAIGIAHDDLHWRANAYRPPTINGMKRCEFGSGVHANVDAMARIGYLYLREGEWDGDQLLPAEFCRQVGQTPPQVEDLPEHSPEYGNASQHYGLLWWNNNDGTLDNVPRDAFWSWGLYDSLIVVVPSLNLVAARAGKSWPREEGTAHYDVLKPFLANLAGAAAQEKTVPVNALTEAPYPASKHIVDIEWAPADSIVRLAEGSDNWPLAWGDDDALYTAYGDGWGFEPKVEKKLSMGFARVEGPPSQPVGTNIRSASGEMVGQGAKGVKASGMLMVDGTLYLLARNFGNARLAWSINHARTWEWVEWRFRESFGCPSFLSFGRGYADARDDFVYMYSQDSDSAYEPGDAVVLARVPQERIRDRDAYSFFGGLDENQEPQWRNNVEDRAAVFRNPGQCYRMSVSYHPPSGRYLMCQILPESNHPQGMRFQGGFGIYDAPEPWGPWTTVYFTRDWDAGPGETAHLPPKWMADDGTALHLVFSGNDCFSVRQATITLSKRATGQE